MRCAYGNEILLFFWSPKPPPLSCSGLALQTRVVCWAKVFVAGWHVCMPTYEIVREKKELKLEFKESKFEMLGVTLVKAINLRRDSW